MQNRETENKAADSKVWDSLESQGMPERISSDALKGKSKQTMH